MAEEASATVDQLCFEAVRPLPSWALAHAAKARAGKLRSLVALKCGDCTNWQKTEIAGCTPVPLRAIVIGELVALLVTARVPE